MLYLIDGHNLIGKLPDISLKDPNDEAKLVQKLAGFAARTQSRCVVVFDQGLPGGESRMSTHSVSVIFASHKSSADRVMIDRIHKERHAQSWTVVSADNVVLDAARRKRMQALKSEDFARMLVRPAQPAKPGPDVAAEVHLSPKEIDEWLALFGEQ